MGGVTSAEPPNPYKMGGGGGVTPVFLFIDRFIWRVPYPIS